LIERQVEIATPDGVADGLLYLPDAAGSWPGILFLTDIGGIRDSQRAMSARLCSEGYAVLMPNLFYRSGKPPIFAQGLKFGGEAFAKRMQEITAPLIPEAIERDGAAYVNFLASRQGVKAPFAAVGLCYSGAIALRIAAVRPDQIALAASFHGGRLVVDSPASPHLLLPKIKARLYFGHAFDDRSMTADAIGKLNQALKDWGGKYESEVYEGAHHGWTVSDNPAYNPVQAERAFAKFKDLLKATL